MSNSKTKQVFKTEKEFEEFKSWTVGLLKDNEMSKTRITFVKKDGTERQMTCTLSESKIPEDKRPKNTKEYKNTDSIPVFDLDKQEWRSFRWDSVIKVEFDL